MATIQRGNWSFRDPGDDIPDGSTINGGNFSQLEPGTEILIGKTLTINGGNWVNVAQDEAWTVNGGNWTQVSRCSNLHPELIEKGLDECVENCSHVVDTDEVWIDGELVDTVYHYNDTVQT
jgi:hypothetical protein